MIECFTADRAPLYVALEKDLEEYYLQRQACWQHARHYLVDAFVSDHRVLVLIQLINALFLIEREAKVRNYTPERRHRFRIDYSASIVGKIMSLLKKIRAEKDYSLYESCKMNDIDFGEYVEDILTRMMNGDDDYRSMIPCYYTPGKKQEKRSLDTIKWRKVKSDKFFQKIMLAVMPVKSGLRSYGGLQAVMKLNELRIATNK